MSTLASTTFHKHAQHYPIVRSDAFKCTRNDGAFMVQITTHTHVVDVERAYGVFATVNVEHGAQRVRTERQIGVLKQVRG